MGRAGSICGVCNESYATSRKNHDGQALVEANAGSHKKARRAGVIKLRRMQCVKKRVGMVGGRGLYSGRSMVPVGRGVADSIWTRRGQVGREAVVVSRRVWWYGRSFVVPVEAGAGTGRGCRTGSYRSRDGAASGFQQWSAGDGGGLWSHMLS